MWLISTSMINGCPHFKTSNDQHLGLPLSVFHCHFHWGSLLLILFIVCIVLLFNISSTIFQSWQEETSVFSSEVSNSGKTYGLGVWHSTTWLPSSTNYVKLLCRMILMGGWVLGGSGYHRENYHVDGTNLDLPKWQPLLQDYFLTTESSLFKIIVEKNLYGFLHDLVWLFFFLHDFSKAIWMAMYLVVSSFGVYMLGPTICVTLMGPG